MSEQKSFLNGTGKKVITCIAIIVGVYLTFRFLLPLVLPFVIAGVVSLLYYPFLRKLYKNSNMWNGKKKKWLLVISVVLFYAVILLFLFWLASYLFGQGQSIWLNFPFYQARAVYWVQGCCCQMDTFFRIEDGASFAYMENMIWKLWENILSGILPKVTSYSVMVAGRLFGIVFELVIMVIATFFIIQDYEQIRDKMLQSGFGRSMCRVITKCKETLKTYVRAQGLIMLLDGTLCTLAFLVIGQPYFLVLGPLVAIVDALPVLGAGLILIPYTVLLLLTKEFGKALILILAYLGCLLVRQITEPKMIGKKVGIRPLYTIISMYVGFQLFGVFGFLLGPLGVLIGKELYKAILVSDTEEKRTKGHSENGED